MNGITDTDNFFSPSDPMAKLLIAEAEADTAEVKSKQSPAGAFGLSEEFDKKRLEFGIVDGAFREQPAFDRVLVWQIGPYEDGTVERGKILIPDTTIGREKAQAPRGILISAGLSALDQLESHGIQIGDTISFLREAPYRISCGRTAGGREFYLIILTAGDIVSSEDLRARLRSGETVLKRISYTDPTTGAAARVSIYVNRGDVPVSPQMAAMPSDY